ncbi:MAG TPA: hypothetical protein V6C86_26340 [Oculatellaceae cyanobacterium]
MPFNAPPFCKPVCDELCKSLSKSIAWRNSRITEIALIAIIIFTTIGLSGCAEEPGDAELTSHTQLELVDWHVSGLWVINCPVAWVRVANYNSVPIKNITFQYDTYDIDGKHLDRGTYTVEESVEPGSVRNFIELYVGLVNLHSDKLSVKLLSVGR